MGRFLLKTGLMMLLLLFGIIFGMQQANQNMKKMQGYDDPTMYSAFSLDKLDNGDLQAQLMGNKITVEDIETKKEKMEEWKTFNLFSSAGKGLSDLFTGLFKGLASMLDSQ